MRGRLQGRGSGLLISALAALHPAHVAHLSVGYAAVLARHGFDAAVLHSGRLQKRSSFDDQYWPLRAVPHFQHWAPLAWPDCAVVFEPGRRPLLVRLRTVDFWEQPAEPEADFWLQAFDVRDVADAGGVRDALPSGQRIAFVGDDDERRVDWGLDAHARDAATIRALDALRTTKTPYEIACLAEANRRAAGGHRAVRDAFLAGGVSELDLHLTFLRATAQDDSETPYKNIVAVGRNAAVLHHIAYGRRPDAGGATSLLLDAGATCLGYAADVTRTWTRGSGAAAAAFGGLVAGVDAMQRRLCDQVERGPSFETLHDACHVALTHLLADIGVLRRGSLSVEGALAAGVSRAFLPHGLGHSLGLQVHDVGCALRPPRPDNPWLRATVDIAPGHVFTIEPGVYFIESLLAPLRVGPVAGALDWALVDALAPFGGVRIEDDVVVPADPLARARNLTREQFDDAGGPV
ncbi:MAG: Xaa-Pro dipeptidase [Myxococcales bacterium]|nr:Xaa-Pro dipeptidase [Myxococcales bacterium]